MAHTAAIWSISLSRNDYYFASAGFDGVGKVWRITTGQVLKNLIGHDDCIWSILITNNSKFIITASFDLSIKIWNTDFENSTSVNGITLEKNSRYESIYLEESLDSKLLISA